MSSLLAALPAPKHVKEDESIEELAPPPIPVSNAVVTAGPPPYGARLGWVPRKPEEFGGGGAFPEIHIAQYPLDMGRPDKKGRNDKTSQTLALTVNADGDVNYDAILRQGAARNKIIASTHSALVPKLEKLNSEMPKPEEEEVQKTAKETAEALAKVVERKRAAVDPQSLPAQPGAAQYIKYIPSSSVPGAVGTRIIKMQEMPVDPLEPPQHKHVRVPRATGSPPPPVMHSPPRALTAKDQQDWKIPPCVSNWKNAKGYTIPLDKRLAADGRGLQEVQINNNFAKFSEALYIAENKARSAVEARGKMQRELMAREKERKEMELRELALKARLDRVGGATVPSYDAQVSPPQSASEEDELPAKHRIRQGLSREDEETKAERDERRRREEIRDERRRERERERRLESKDAHGYKRSKITRDRERDVSERIALGMAKVSGGEAMYDQRLFNQDVGMATGLVQEDAYNLYDKPLFADRGELFKATGRQDDETYAAGGKDEDRARIKPDKGFAGAEHWKAGGGALVFERDTAEEADPFGLGAFLSDVKGGKKEKENPLDVIGKRGGMSAAAGGSVQGEGSGRERKFVSGGE